jgi:hypothetical protein
VAKYRKRPVVIEAVQWFPGVEHEALSPAFDHMDGETPIGVGIQTPEGFMLVSPGDWIITGVAGERYPCKPGIFEATYEPAEGESIEDLTRRLIGSKHFIADGQGGDWMTWDVLAEDELRERLGMESS